MIAGGVVVEGRAALAESGVAFIVEKDDVEMGLGAEQRAKGATHLQGELAAFRLVMPQQAEQDTACGTREIGPRHTCIEIEQDGDRFLEPPLVRAILFGDEADVGRGELMQHQKLPGVGIESVGIEPLARKEMGTKRKALACPSFRRSNW